jgi:ATP-dependent helicase HrpA
MRPFRIIVIAPTRSTCLNISLVLENDSIPKTLLMQEKEDEIFEALGKVKKGGFGVVAGTGTGKTVSIRDIAHFVLQEDLRVDMVTRESEATEYTWTCNIIVVTPGIALHWFQNDVIAAADLLVVDEIHQTSEHLELSLALAKRNGNKIVWMSATIDPDVYARYLEARTVIRCRAYDPSRRAVVKVLEDNLVDFLSHNIESFIKERRGVAVFVPTRAMAEQMAKLYGGFGRINSDFYHGGEKVEKLRQFLEGGVPRPFMVFMTSAGASSLNITGLDTVVIVDECFKEVVHSGVPVFEKTRLGSNDLLQMGGRVNGRAIGGKIFILTTRVVNFHSLKPESPQFVLGGDLQHVALVCARLGVDLSDLDLITQVDKGVYAQHVKRFRERGIINKKGTLTDYGSEVEQLPVTPAWAEMVVHAKKLGDERLFDVVVGCAGIDSLYSLIRKEADLSEVGVSGSDHLTGYNIVATALRKFGSIEGSGGDVNYEFRGDYVNKSFDGKTGLQTVEKGEFIEWCELHGFNGKAIREATLAMKSVYHQLGMQLPQPSAFKSVVANGTLAADFIRLLAIVGSLDFVSKEYHPEAGTVWTARHSVCHPQGNIWGTIRYWKDTKYIQRATIEGTEVPAVLVR